VAGEALLVGNDSKAGAAVTSTGRVLGKAASPFTKLSADAVGDGAAVNAIVAGGLPLVGNELMTVPAVASKRRELDKAAVPCANAPSGTTGAANKVRDGSGRIGSNVGATRPSGNKPSRLFGVRDVRAGSRPESCGFPGAGIFAVFPAPFRTDWKMAVKGEGDCGSNGSSVTASVLGAFAGDGFEMGVACIVVSRPRLPGQVIASGPPRLGRPQIISSGSYFKDNKGDETRWHLWREI
jgi:hypothetical protein